MASAIILVRNPSVAVPSPVLYTGKFISFSIIAERKKNKKKTPYLLFAKLKYRAAVMSMSATASAPIQIPLSAAVGFNPS